MVRTPEAAITPVAELQRLAVSSLGQQQRQPAGSSFGQHSSVGEAPGRAALERRGSFSGGAALRRPGGLRGGREVSIGRHGEEARHGGGEEA